MAVGDNVKTASVFPLAPAVVAALGPRFYGASVDMPQIVADANAALTAAGHSAEVTAAIIDALIAWTIDRVARYQRAWRIAKGLPCKDYPTGLMSEDWFTVAEHLHIPILCAERDKETGYWVVLLGVVVPLLLVLIVYSCCLTDARDQCRQHEETIHYLDIARRKCLLENAGCERLRQEATATCNSTIAALRHQLAAKPQAGQEEVQHFLSFLMAYVRAMVIMTSFIVSLPLEVIVAVLRAVSRILQ
jgi:hypothetical protein